MECKGCGSQNVQNFNGELAIHFPGLAGLTKPIVWVFPRLEVCVACGSTKLTVPEKELNVLRQGLASPDTRAPKNATHN